MLSLISLIFLLSITSADATAPVAEGCPTSTDTLSETFPDLDYLDAEDPRLQRDGLIVVFKERRRIGLYRGGVLIEIEGAPACWSVGLAMAYPAGPKRREGDMKTPEGFYSTSDKPWSSFYHAIAVHYPNADDAAAGMAAGLISSGSASQISRATGLRQKPNQYTNMGGEILIHGGGGDSDWTLGCIAMDDLEIDALRALLPAGVSTYVLILP